MITWRRPISHTPARQNPARSRCLICPHSSHDLTLSIGRYSRRRASLFRCPECIAMGPVFSAPPCIIIKSRSVAGVTSAPVALATFGRRGSTLISGRVDFITKRGNCGASAANRGHYQRKCLLGRRDEQPATSLRLIEYTYSVFSFVHKHCERSHTHTRAPGTGHLPSILFLAVPSFLLLLFF